MGCFWTDLVGCIEDCSSAPSAAKFVFGLPSGGGSGDGWLDLYFFASFADMIAGTPAIQFDGAVAVSGYFYSSQDDGANCGHQADMLPAYGKAPGDPIIVGDGQGNYNFNGTIVDPAALLADGFVKYSFSNVGAELQADVEPSYRILVDDLVAASSAPSAAAPLAFFQVTSPDDPGTTFEGAGTLNLCF